MMTPSCNSGGNGCRRPEYGPTIRCRAIRIQDRRTTGNYGESRTTALGNVRTLTTSVSTTNSATFKTTGPCRMPRSKCRSRHEWDRRHAHPDDDGYDRRRLELCNHLVRGAHELWR